MHQRPVAEREQRLGPAVCDGVARLLVLVDRLVERLGEVGLELDRGDRDAVDEED